MNELIENKKKSEILAERIASLNYGDAISHAEISEIIQEAHKSYKYVTVIQQTRKVLLKEYGRVLESVRGDGYRVIKPDDYVAAAMRLFGQGANKIKKGTDTLQRAPVRDMSDEGREIYRRFNDRVTILHASVKGAMVELKTLGEKQHPFLPEHVNS